MAKKSIMIDVRTPQEFETKHIKGSHNIPLEEFIKHKEEISKIDKEIILICRTENRSKAAYKLLREQGAKNVEIMAGGITACETRGNKIVIGTNKWDIERQVRLAAGTLVVIGAILGYTISPYFFLLSMFVGLGLIFASITNTCTMAMILMKLPYNSPTSKTDIKEKIKKLNSSIM